MDGFYTRKELIDMGFKKVGENPLISTKASFYFPKSISLGDNVRIDDFCELTGNIEIGSYVHIGVGSYLAGGKDGIVLSDFSGLSSRCAIYAQSDDYSGEHLTNPTIPEKYLGIYGGKVVLGKHVIIGTGSTILPGCNIGEGVAVGAMSLISKDLKEWTIYAGVPCKMIKERKKDLLEFEKELLREK